MQMKTSVIMTVYNGSKYLLEMLESLRNQSPVTTVLEAVDPISIPT